MTPNTEIKYLLLDLGNVLVDVDFEEIYHKSFSEEFNKLKKDLLFKEFYSLFEQEFIALNEGSISNLDLYQIMKARLNLKKLELEEFKKIWFSVLKNPTPIYDFLNKNSQILKQKFTIIMASNTDKWHFEFLRDKYKYSFIDYFFLSYKEKLIKPNQNYFESLLKKYAITNPAEALFIDDRKENLVSAQNLKINTIHNLNHQETIAKLTQIITGN